MTSGYSYCRGFLTAVIVALAVATVFGTPLSVALMVGAVLAASDPAILIPLFDAIRLRLRGPRPLSPSLASTIRWAQSSRWRWPVR